MVALFMSVNTLFIQQRFNKYFETNYINYVKRGEEGVGAIVVIQKSGFKLKRGALKSLPIPETTNPRSGTQQVGRIQ